MFHQYVHNAGELWIDSVEWGGTRGWWSLFEEAEFDGWWWWWVVVTAVVNVVNVVNVVDVVNVDVDVVVDVVVDAFARGLGWARCAFVFPGNVVWESWSGQCRRKQIQGANVVLVLVLV